MARLRYNGLTATLGAALTSSGTSVTFAAALTHAGGAVPTIGGSDTIALSILGTGGNVVEIVSLTAYTSGATTGTIARAQESTTATTHASGATVVHAPTAADFVGSGGVAGALGPTPDDIPASPSAYDGEFNGSGSSLPAGWGWVNQSTSSYAEGSGSGLLTLATTGADEWRGITRAIPAAASFTATAKLGMVLVGAAGKFPSRGIALRDSASGKLVILHHIQAPYDQVSANPLASAAVDKYTNPTTFSARQGSQVNLMGAYDFRYLRIKKNSGTSWDFQISAHGVGWLPVATGVDLSAFITPNEIGVVANGRSLAPILSVDWFRVS